LEEIRELGHKLVKESLPYSSYPSKALKFKNNANGRKRLVACLEQSMDDYYEYCHVRLTQKSASSRR
jgi:hypothetical protein